MRPLSAVAAAVANSCHHADPKLADPTDPEELHKPNHPERDPNAFLRHPRYFFLTVFTEVTFTCGITIGRRIGTSPAPGCCCCCIRVSISVRT